MRIDKWRVWRAWNAELNSVAPASTCLLPPERRFLPVRMAPGHDVVNTFFDRNRAGRQEKVAPGAWSKAAGRAEMGGCGVVSGR